MTFGTTRVAVAANCQARPIATLLKLLCPQIEVRSVTIVHLAKDVEADQVYKDYTDCDFIFAQAVQDGYPTKFVTTNNLTRLFPDKIVTWPNLFFRGQCPDVRYINSKNRRILGPLGEYQNTVVYHAWEQGLNLRDAVNQVRYGERWIEELVTDATCSLNELKIRESSLDIRVSDYIEARWRERRLFHTFNHPRNELLIYVAQALLRYIDLVPQEQATLKTYPEALDPIIPGVSQLLAERLELKFDCIEETKGVRVDIDEDVKIDYRNPVYYDWESLIETSFRAFDRQLSSLDPVRIS